MSGGRESGSGSRMGAIRLERGKLEEKKRTERSKKQGKLERDNDGDDAWPQMHDGWNPSSMLYEATFTAGQAAGAHGRVPRQRAGCKTRDQRDGERERGGLVVCELSQDVGNAARTN